MAFFETRRDLGTTAALAKSADTQFKVIDVSEKPLIPNVVRKGKSVPFVELDPRVVDSIIGPDVIVQPGEAPRVVSQSIPPGTKVARGASVDLVLAPRIQIPGRVIAGGHIAFAEQSIEEIVTTFLADQQVIAAVLDFDTPDDLPDATRNLVVQRLEQANVNLVDGDTTQDFNAAFRTLQGAAAFQ